MSFKFENNVIKTEERKFDYLMGVGEAIFQLMQEHSDKIAQIDDKSGKTDTYKSLLKKCVQTAIELKRRNIKKGDIIAICCFNHLNTCVPLIASYFIGALPFIINVGYPSVWRSTTETKPKVIFCDQGSEEPVRNFLKDSTEVQSQVAVFDSSFEKEFLISRPDEEAAFKPIHIEDLSESSALFFSGGTTAGTPKIIHLNHYNLIRSLDKSAPNNGQQGVHTSNVAWSWIGGVWYLLRATAKGDCRILVDKFYEIVKDDFDNEKLWQTIEKYKVSHLMIFPVVVRSLFKIDKIDYDVSSLKAILAAGAPLLDECHKQLKTHLPNATLINGYGGSEFGHPFEFTNEEQSKLVGGEMQSVGRPVTGYWIKVVDPDTETTLGPNEIGELRLKSKYFLANGYLQHEEWVKCFDEQGWFKTGDLVYYDEKFRFYVKDRIKFISVSNGYRIFPVPIESILIQHPAVKDVAVIGIPTKSPHALDSVAVVSLKKDYKTTPEELLKYFEEQRPANMKGWTDLTAGVRIVDSLPVNAVGKVMKFKLKEMIINNSL